MSTDQRRTVILKDVHANPFRNFDIYPLREDKVSSLMESIRRTGFWGNIIARDCDGEIQIPFGHHRLAALFLMFHEDMEVELQIKNISDSQMIKMMAHENAEEWSCPVAAIDDAVMAARNHLRDNPETAREALSSKGIEVKRGRVGAPAIAAFLNKKQGAVQLALERINLIESGKVDREALYLMPSANAADLFSKAITANRKTSTPEAQRRMAERIVETQRFGERSIIETVTEYFPRDVQREVIERDRANYLEALMRMAIRQIALLRTTLAKLIEPRDGTFFVGPQTIEDIPAGLIESYNRSVIALSDAFEKVGKDLSEGRPAGPRPLMMPEPEPEPSDEDEQQD